MNFWSKQEVYSEGKEMHNEMSGQWFLKRKWKMMVELVIEDEERVSISYNANQQTTEIKFFRRYSIAS